MSAGQAPKRRGSSIIERSAYAPNRPQGDDRRRELEALGQDRVALERAKQDIAAMSRQQGGRASASVQLDDIEVQQRKSLRMVVAPAPQLPDPTSSADVQSDADVTPAPDLPPAINNSSRSIQPPASAVPKNAPAKAPAPASRSMFEHVEHRPERSAATAHPVPTAHTAAYARDEHYESHEVYPYWEVPMILVRNNPLLLMILAALVCVPVILMFLQSPRTFVSSYNGAGFSDTVGDVVSKVFGGNDAAFVPPSIDVPAGEHSILGPPSITVDQIEAVLTQYNSPARGTGKIWFALGQQYGIDPAYPLAFFVQESTAGSNSGWAGLKSGGGTTHNVGNIICAGYATCYKGNRDYPSWEAGIDDWYRLIAREYVKGRGLASVEQILPIYCPVSDGCRSYDYISIVNSMVEKWHQGQLFQ